MLAKNMAINKNYYTADNSLDSPSLTPLGNHNGVNFGVGTHYGKILPIVDRK